MKRRLSATLLFVVLAVTACGVTAPSSVAPAHRPNVLLIITDDLRWDKVNALYTPNIAKLAAGQDAITFTNAMVTNPLCCPSRTTILTGRYSHTTGVWTNSGPYGGFRAFDDRDTLAVDLQDAGYRTGMVGKYLNGYDSGTDRYVPPGWSYWFSVDTGNYYRYGVTTKGGTRFYGSEPADYSTRVLTKQALHFIAGGNNQPFFLYFATTAPHSPATPDPRDINRFAGKRDYRFNDRHSSALEAAFGADRAVGRILAAVPADTIVLFLSDNGYMWHERYSDRGAPHGKILPYNASIRVPMVFASLDGEHMPIAGPSDLVSNVDVRTSLLHAAGLAPRSTQEGLDWFAPDYAPRTRLLIEHGGGPSQGDRLGITYCGVRTADYLYVRFKENAGYTQELFAEPDELTNLAPDDPALDGLAAWTRQACDPPPPGYSWTP